MATAGIHPAARRPPAGMARTHNYPDVVDNNEQINASASLVPSSATSAAVAVVGGSYHYNRVRHKPKPAPQPPRQSHSIASGSRPGTSSSSSAPGNMVPRTSSDIQINVEIAAHTGGGSGGVVASHSQATGAGDRSRNVVSDPSGMLRVYVDVGGQGNRVMTSQPCPSTGIHTNNLDAGVSRPDCSGGNQALPDILNSHMLPPYTARPNQSRSARHGAEAVRQQQQQQQQHRARSPTRTPGSQSRGRSSRSSRSNRTRTSSQSDHDAKICCSAECCFHCLTVTTTFRWVLVALALLGVCCVLTGIVLGVLHVTGTSYLTLSLMFIGLGVMLVIVVGIGWRCTPTGHEPCHLLFNLGEHSTRDISRGGRAARLRDRHQWWGGMLYPEFRHRRPPPSYNASMQEFQQQLVLAQLQINEGSGLPNSPPPTYKSQASPIRPGLHITFPELQGGDYPNSRPPTYRSNAGTNRANRPAIPFNQDTNGDQTAANNQANGSANGYTNGSATTDNGQTIQITTAQQNNDNSQNGSQAHRTLNSENRVVVSESTGLSRSVPVGASASGVDIPRGSSGHSRQPSGASSLGDYTQHRGFQAIEYLEVMLDDQLKDMGGEGERKVISTTATSSAASSLASVATTQPPTDSQGQSQGQSTGDNADYGDTPL